VFGSEDGGGNRVEKEEGEGIGVMRGMGTRSIETAKGTGSGGRRFEGEQEMMRTEKKPALARWG
jgi:hypothetical protein